MENYIKHITDITYQAELIPAASLCEASRRGLIRTYNLRLLLFRKLCAH
jgi:hypothetical protein